MEDEVFPSTQALIIIQVGNGKLGITYKQIKKSVCEMDPHALSAIKEYCPQCFKKAMLCI